jgi:uncharacterized protein (DUF885 family)
MLGNLYWNMSRFSSRNFSRRDFLAAGTAVGAGFASFAGAQTQSTTRTIDDFFRDFTADWVRHSPTLATSSRYFTGDEQDSLERQLTPDTRDWKLDRIRRAREGLAELAGFKRTPLTPAHQVSVDLMEWQLNDLTDEEPFLDYTFPLEQMNGANVSLVETLTVRHPLVTERDAENYLAALKEVRARMEEAIAAAKRLEAGSVIPPKFILQATVKQMQGFSDPSPGQNPFVTVFIDKISGIKTLTDAKREQLRIAAEKTVGEQIYPAWKQAIAVLESQIPKSTDDAGLWRLKGGAEAYNYYLRHYTTTSLTAAQIHEIGLQKVADIEGQMDALLKRLGRTDGTVKARIEKLQLEMQYPNPTSDESRAQIMRDIDGILADSLSRSALLFDLRPKSPVIAQPFPKFREANAAANYNAPAPDGSRPGIFQFPRRIENMTKFGLRSLVYHETVPGHHFQIAFQTEDTSLPRFRQIRALGGLSAHTEGWGLYAERLAAESNWYAEDVPGLLGQLNYELFRARRLVVDTGIHAMKWTRQQSIDYGIESSEVERYTVYPGQACSYMIGELKIIELREKVKKALGDKFSLREYHNLVLRTGTVPLEILARQVDGYISAHGGKV